MIEEKTPQSEQQENFSIPFTLMDKWPWILAVIFFLLGFIKILENYSYILIGKSPKDFLVKSFIFVVPKQILWFLFSFFIFKLYKRFSEKEQKYNWKLHLLCSVLIAILHSIINRFFIQTLFYVGFPEEMKTTFLDSLVKSVKFILPETISGCLTYWFILLLFAAMEFYDRYQSKSFKSLKLESKLINSQLTNLKTQLQPHFLFNTLNTIAMMVRQNKNKEGVKMIAGLSDLLRNTLDGRNKQLVTLSEELQLLNKYIAIELNRFSDRLTYEKEIEPDMLQAKVPHFLLQPLVENAFKYGLTASFSKMLLRLEAKQKVDFLVITIYNSGSLLTTDYSEGIGLKNTKARLENLYDGQANLTLKNAMDNSGVEAILKIPFKPKSM